MLPRLSDISRDDTHRLIPSRYTEKDETVLARLTADAGDLSALFELEGATNDRLLGEAGLLPGITVRELVFGLSYSHIVNAAFTHARPLGSRFNGPERGAWYSALPMRRRWCRASRPDAGAGSAHPAAESGNCKASLDPPRSDRR